MLVLLLSAEERNASVDDMAILSLANVAEVALMVAEGTVMAVRGGCTWTFLGDGVKALTVCQQCVCGEGEVLWG